MCRFLSYVSLTCKESQNLLFVHTAKHVVFLAEHHATAESIKDQDIVQGNVSTPLLCPFRPKSGAFDVDKKRDDDDSSLSFFGGGCRVCCCFGCSLALRRAKPPTFWREGVTSGSHTFSSHTKPQRYWYCYVEYSILLPPSSESHYSLYAFK